MNAVLKEYVNGVETGYQLEATVGELDYPAKNIGKEYLSRGEEVELYIYKKGEEDGEPLHYYTEHGKVY